MFRRLLAAEKLYSEILFLTMKNNKAMSLNNKYEFLPF